MSASLPDDAPHFSWLWMLENVVANFEPIPFTTAMIATEMPAAMSPYSMAVAPDSFFAKRETRVFIVRSLVHTYCLSPATTVVTQSIRTVPEATTSTLNQG